MKIQNMELFKVPPRWLFLKLTTDDGIVGWGEPIVEGKADAVRACVEELKDQLLGREAGNIEELWQTMYRCNSVSYTHLSPAISPARRRSLRTSSPPTPKPTTPASRKEAIVSGRTPPTAVMGIWPRGPRTARM